MNIEDVLEALRIALIYRLEGAFDVELKKWSRQSGIEMMGTESIEAGVLAEIVEDYLGKPTVKHDVIIALAEMANRRAAA